MSGEERDCSFLVREAVACRVGQRAASERLGIGVRQFKRLVRAWKQDGDAGLVSRQRGQPSNNRMKDDQRCRIAISVFPSAKTGTVVSSACRRSAAMT